MTGDRTKYRLKSGDGLLCDGDIVGVTDSEDLLQELINVVQAFCRKLRLNANVSKYAVFVFQGFSKRYIEISESRRTIAWCLGCSYKESV